MSTKFNWNSKKAVTPTIYFKDLFINECFSINSPHSKGAIYMKVFDTTTNQYMMLEIATGKLFRHTSNSPVLRQNVEINLEINKPAIYGSSF